MSAKYLFTFGCGSPLGMFVQPVLAKDESEARQAMWKFYDGKWAFCYRLGDCPLKLDQFTMLPEITVHANGEVCVEPQQVQQKPLFRYKVRLTRMLNTWVEVEAANQDEAESKAYDEVVGKAKDDPCWTDDDDVQVEDDTHVRVSGGWTCAKFVPRELGGEGMSPTTEDD